MPRAASRDRACPVDARLGTERANEACRAYGLSEKVEYRSCRHERVILAVTVPAATLQGCRSEGAPSWIIERQVPGSRQLELNGPE
jgi:hypothetical protein